MTLLTQKNIAPTTILALAILPIVRWLMIAPISPRFADLGMVTTSLGQIAGILGLTLFSINLIISYRTKFFDKFFYGLNNLYNFHHENGAIAFSLLLFHPLFLAVQYLQISLNNAAKFFLPGQNQAVTFGIISLALMIVLMVLTFYFKIKYNHWKISHKFMVLVFGFALLHAFLISSDISRDNLLRFYILGLAIFGLAAGFYQAFLSKFLNNNSEYKITRLTILNSATVEIELEAKAQNRLLKFTPGQFIFIRFLSPQVSAESHPFSISSAAREKNLKLTIKSLGDFTDKLKNLEIGTRALTQGPFGKFSYGNIANKNQIWIAGGIGITPFLSMARSLTDNDYKIDLYYCTRDRQEAVLLAELQKISSLNQNLKIIPWYSESQGRIAGSNIAELSHGLNDKAILLCGPGPFMTSLGQQFLELGAKNKNIYSEQFKLL